MEHPQLRRLGGLMLAVVIAAAGVIGLIAFFNARDDSTFDSGTQGPGLLFADQGAGHLRPGEPNPIYNSDPPTSGQHRPVLPRANGGLPSDDEIVHALELGNVVLLHGPGVDPAPLLGIAQQLDATYSRDLAQAGAAVLVAGRRGVEGVVALAWRHMQKAPAPNDPSLREFTEYHLGRGPSS